MIDFNIPHELHELVQRVRAYVEEDVLPAEAATQDRHDLDRSWRVVGRLRARARQRGIFAPHLPPEWGGLGVGMLGASSDPTNLETTAVPEVTRGMSLR